MFIQLTKKEYEFISNEKFLADALLEKVLSNTDENFLLTIDEDSASEIRDECGEHLQMVGFDKNDNPTEKGLILEDLIDKFFIG